MDKFYIDDLEEGTSRDTCHPNFNSILSDDIYINIVDEFAPFGNDEGWETLRKLEKWYLNKDNSNSIILDFITNYSMSHWGWSEIDLPELQIFEIEEINRIQKEKKYFFEIFPQIIIATAFGQFKITGKIDDYLKEITQRVIEQQKLIAQNRISKNEIDLSKLIKIVNKESTRLNNQGNMNNIFEEYIERLTIMNKDLERIPVKKMSK